MSKHLKRKKILQFLNNDYPENLIPSKKIQNKYKSTIVDKKIILKKIKKRIETIQNFSRKIYSKKNQNSKLVKNSNFYFLFSSEQLKKDILKKQIQQKNYSDFLTKLKERKKYSILYGNISKKVFNKTYNRAKSIKGKVNDNLLIQFETRLDVLLYRISFSKSIKHSRQLITHCSVTVNGIIITIPSYQLKAGDILSINKKSKISSQLLNHLKKKLIIRQCKYLLSYKKILKYLKRNNNSNKTINILKYRFYLIYNKYKKLRKKSLLSKKLALIEAISKANNLKRILPTIPRKINSLNFIESMYKKRSRQNSLLAMQLSCLKPMHVEVSFKLLTAIFLYSPQKISFPALLNRDLITRSFIE